ncbi:hypothetical protein IE81DRAFT_345063 [Ceraceosorus guamensis]|uniref:Uncharacterized protein n=1 Tax=Ceraceosorus guamensis TaxID=1522189 RepID=A0A316W8C2_9BASI|nr:hypothetical protein IE81DRAFT_345063 [Ceraceosorus guamensis]PWN45001.1 hypothetical protein IE81DRAFT_345063 [Ceraceosorus guamensis]
MEDEDSNRQVAYDDQGQDEYLDEQQQLLGNIFGKDVDEDMLAEETTSIIESIHSGRQGVDNGQLEVDELGEDEPGENNPLAHKLGEDGMLGHEPVEDDMLGQGGVDGAPMAFTDPIPRGLMVSPSPPPDRETVDEAAAAEEARIQAALDAAKRYLSAEWLYNAWTRDNTPPAWRDALTSLLTANLEPGFSRYVFPMGKARLGVDPDVRGDIQTSIETYVRFSGLSASTVRLWRGGPMILGADIKFAAGTDIDPSLFRIDNHEKNLHLEWDKTCLSLGEGMMVIGLDSVLDASLRDRDGLIKAIKDQLSAQGYALRCLWAIYLNVRGEIEGPPRYNDRLLAVVELVGEESKIHGFMNLPGSPRCFVSYHGRGYWCTSCMWRRKDQHRQTEACKEAEAERRRIARAVKAVPKQESSIDPVPPMRGHSIILGPRASRMRASATPAPVRPRTDSPPPPPPVREVALSMPPPTVPAFFRRAPAGYQDRDQPAITRRTEPLPFRSRGDSRASSVLSSAPSITEDESAMRPAQGPSNIALAAGFPVKHKRPVSTLGHDHSVAGPSGKRQSVSRTASPEIQVSPHVVKATPPKGPQK